MTTKILKSKKLLFFLTEDWFFCSHFLDRALGAVKAGCHVTIVSKKSEASQRIKDAGLNFIELDISRKGVNLLKEFQIFLKVVEIYRLVKPDIVHQISPKPIFYGTIASKISKVGLIVNAPVGMGYVFSSNDLKARVLRPFVKLAYKFLVNTKNSKVIFENYDDLGTFIKWNAVRPNDAVVIRGAGVNQSFFQQAKRINPYPVISFVARMLRDKGIFELLQAARELNSRGIRAEFLLIGTPDENNPTSITETELRKWSGKYGIKWMGWHTDIQNILRKTDIMCLPSYREGLPKALIEAAASSLPIVTTDTVGCREVVKDKFNGFLVPVKNVPELANALEKLIVDKDLRLKMGRRSRKLAEESFSSELVVKQTITVYSDFFQKI